MEKKRNSDQQLISIVIATRNSETQLSDAEERWKKPSYRCEIIIQDGGSSDGTMGILERLQRKGIVRSFDSELDRGPYDAWNKAIHKCKGNWILFYGDGDVIPVEWLDTVERVSNQQFDILTASLKICNESRSESIETRIWQPRDRNDVFNLSMLPHVGMAHSRFLFENARFNTQYRISGDREFLIRSWPLRVRCMEGVSQGVMVLGGLSNSPEHFEQSYHEGLLMAATHNLDVSVARKSRILAKRLLRRCPVVWRILQRLSLKIRSRVDI